MMIVARMLKQTASAIPAFIQTFIPSCAFIPTQNIYNIMLLLTFIHDYFNELGLWPPTIAFNWLGPFDGAIAAPSVTRCRCYCHRCRRGHQCDTLWMGVRRLAVANGPKFFKCFLFFWKSETVKTVTCRTARQYGLQPPPLCSRMLAWCVVIICKLDKNFFLALWWYKITYTE